MTLTITVTAKLGGQVATASVTVDVDESQAASFAWFRPPAGGEG